MSRPSVIEKIFTYHDLTCVVRFQNLGFRCGYVGIPKTHPLYGEDYSNYLNIKKEDIKDREIDGVFQLINACLDEDDRITIDAYFRCHGGITYSGGGDNSHYPMDNDLWWFGFDCGHVGDGKDYDKWLEFFPEEKERIESVKRIEKKYETDPFYEEPRNLEYTEENCKMLADQLLHFEKYGN